MIMKKFKTFLLTLTVSFLAACGGGGGGGSAAVDPSDFSGTWSGTYSSTNLSYSITQNGNVLQVTRTEPFLQELTYSGTVTGSQANVVTYINGVASGETSFVLTSPTTLVATVTSCTPPQGYSCAPVGTAINLSKTSTSNLTFNVLAAYISTFTSPSVNNFNITGSSGSTSVTGSGTATIGNVSSGTFEGQSALQRTTTVTGSFVVNGNSYPLNSSQVSWTDSNYVPLGSVDNEYTVISGTPTLPTAVRVGDTGPVYTANRYTSSSKTTPLGTVTSTYVVEADTASTALVTLINTYKNTSNTTTKVASAQFRITTANTFTRIKETAIDYTNGLNLTLTY